MKISYKITACLKPFEKKLLWIVSVEKFKIQGFRKEKENFSYKGIITSKDKMIEPIEIIESVVKDSEEVEILSNYKYIIDYFAKKKIKSFLNKNIELDFSEMITFSEENLPSIPKELNTDSTNEEPFKKMIETNIRLLKTYLYFSENPEKTHETDFIISLKEKGIIPKDMLIEDILSLIEDEFLKDFS